MGIWQESSGRNHGEIVRSTVLDSDSSLPFSLAFPPGMEIWHRRSTRSHGEMVRLTVLTVAPGVRSTLRSDLAWNLGKEALPGVLARW